MCPKRSLVIVAADSASIGSHLVCNFMNYMLAADFTRVAKTAPANVQPLIL